MGLKRDIPILASLGWRTWRDLLRATVELAIARVRLSAKGADESLNLASSSAPASPSNSKGDEPAKLVDRVAFAIPRMGARVPWRADCLVQALAAQRWLDRAGVATEIQIGVRKPGQSKFEAHAWLSAGDRIVVGGNPDSYAPLAAPSRSGHR